MNTLLQQARKAQKLSQEELAKICGLNKKTISRLERGECDPQFFTKKCLCDYFQMSPEELGFLPEERIPVVDKRNFVKFALGIATTPAMFLCNLQNTLLQPRVSKEVVQQMENITMSHIYAHSISPNRLNLFDGIVGHIGTLHNYYNQATSSDIREQLAYNICEEVLLLGEAYYDVNYNQESEQYYRHALQWAEAANNQGLQSFVLSRITLPLIEQGKFVDALPLIKQAQILGHGKMTENRYANILCQAGRIHAGLGDKKETEDALAIAYYHINKATVDPERTLSIDDRRFSPDRYLAYKTECNIALGNYQDALSSLNDSMSQSTHVELRKRILRLGNYATIYAHMGESEAVEEYVYKALPLIKQTNYLLGLSDLQTSHKILACTDPIKAKRIAESIKPMRQMILANA